MDIKLKRIWQSFSTRLKCIRGKKLLLLIALCIGFSMALFGAVYSSIFISSRNSEPVLVTSIQQKLDNKTNSSVTQSTSKEPTRIVRDNPFKNYKFPCQETFDPDIEELRSSSVNFVECKGTITQQADTQWEKTPFQKEKGDELRNREKDIPSQNTQTEEHSSDDQRRNALINIPDGFGSNGYQSHSVPRHNTNDSYGSGGYNGGYNSSPSYSSEYPAPRTNQAPTPPTTPERSYTAPISQPQTQNESLGNKPFYFPSQGLTSNTSSNDLKDKKKSPQLNNKEEGEEEEKKENEEEDNNNSAPKLNENNDGNPKKESSDITLNNNLKIHNINNKEDLKQLTNIIEEIKENPEIGTDQKQRFAEEMLNNLNDINQKNLPQEDKQLIEENKKKLEDFKQSLVPIENPGFVQTIVRKMIDYCKNSDGVKKVIQDVTMAGIPSIIGAFLAKMAVGTPILPVLGTALGGTTVLAIVYEYAGPTIHKYIRKYIFGQNTEDEDDDYIEIKEVPDKPGNQELNKELFNNAENLKKRKPNTESPKVVIEELDKNNNVEKKTIYNKDPEDTYFKPIEDVLNNTGNWLASWFINKKQEEKKLQ